MKIEKFSKIQNFKQLKNFGKLKNLEKLKNFKQFKKFEKNWKVLKILKKMIFRRRDGPRRLCLNELKDPGRNPVGILRTIKKIIFFRL